MIYIETQNSLVTYIHYNPFDRYNGTHKTEEEMRESGYLVDAVPAPEANGKCAALYYENGVFRYEYTDPVPAATETDRLEAQITYTAMMTNTLLEA